MARKYSERIESMDAEAREELDERIREYHQAQGWQKTLAKYKPSPIQLRAILKGKDPMKAKAKRKPKDEDAKPKQKAKKATKKKVKAKAKAKAKTPKAVAKPAKKKPGRPKGSGKKKAAKKNGAVTKTNAQGDLIIEGKIDATDFVNLVLGYSERMTKVALSA